MPDIIVFFLNEKQIYIHYITQFLKIPDTCGLYNLPWLPLTLLSINILQYQFRAKMGKQADGKVYK